MLKPGKEMGLSPVRWRFALLVLGSVEARAVDSPIEHLSRRPPTQDVVLALEWTFRGRPHPGC